MSSGHLGMKWSLFIWDLDRCSNFGVWIMLGFATVRRSASLFRPAASRRRCCCPQLSCLSGVATGARIAHARQVVAPSLWCSACASETV